MTMRNARNARNARSMKTLLWITSLILGVSSDKDAVFVYSLIGGDALLPCTHLGLPNCTSISWEFYHGKLVWTKQEVSWGQEHQDASHISITSNCSLRLHVLRGSDAGTYYCQLRGDAISRVYLSLLSITSSSAIFDLQPGGTLILTCVLFTYFDPGNCKYSNVLNVSWVAEDGTELPDNRRYKLTVHSRCNISLVIGLQKDDHNRRWRCQVNTETSSPVFLDFISAFPFQSPPSAQSRPPAATGDCPALLLVSHIVLCVALPVMVMVVGIFTWRADRRRTKTTPAL